MTVDVEFSDAAMASPTSSSGTGPESLRLSEIESAHLCPAGRLKMEELFRQWLNVDGTKEMIQSMVADLRQGKELNLDALLAANAGAAPPGGVGSGGDSPSRSPKRPPNYQQFGLLASGAGSPSARRRHHHMVSLFGEELHTAACAAAAATPVDAEASQPSQPSEDVDMAVSEVDAGNNPEGESSAAIDDKQDVEPAVAAPTVEEVAPDGDENMEEQQEQTEEPAEPEEATAENDGDEDQTMAADMQKQAQIPRFYTPGEGRRGRLRGLSTDAIARKTIDIEARFRDFPEGMKVEDFVAITKDLCGFPSFFNAPFFRRIVASSNATGETTPKAPTTPVEGGEDATSATDSPAAAERITKEMFQSFWVREMAPCDSVERFFRVVHSSGRITLRKLRRSNLISAFNCVDEEEDINKVRGGRSRSGVRLGLGTDDCVAAWLPLQVNSYFSYEHFYVLYCKFWELDTDHDFLLSQDDLVRYGGHALTRIIVDRIFERGRRPFARVQTLSTEEKKKMSYEDFIYFMLSEEDKSNPVSIRYWFELIDTNEDGVLRADEMRVFYRHQIHRMECLGHEVVPFEDILCQMSDLLHPAKEGEFYHKDFTRSDKIRVSGVLFNVLFNLSKFIEFEQRDPFLLRQQLAEPELTCVRLILSLDWDRYARAEYARLAMEEESRDEDTAMDIDTMEGWYVSDEQEEPAEGEAAAGASGEGRTVEAPF
ncbi:hypothetical protein BBJ28_00013507 [Nothophytophthora sp. Chile5]|nr:hypothetical protein BBJ28_00013507 [Nothophytophthora sp. Chile5]